ncbi:MAG: CapA family protein [Fibrobacter sp.]|nr:CapA family protein [Fibrobacter sp.]
MKYNFADKVTSLLIASGAALFVSCAGSAPAVEPAVAESAKKNEVPVEDSLPERTSEKVSETVEGSVSLQGAEPAMEESRTELNTELGTENEAPVSAEAQAADDLSAVLAASSVVDNSAPDVSQEVAPEPVSGQVAETAAPDTVVTKVSFFAIGDVLFHTPLFDACKKDAAKCNFDHIFQFWKSDIESADIAAVNQETILVSREMGFTSYPAFGTPDQVGEAEIAAGFDIVTHATNHTIDRGAKAVDYTLDFWKGKGDASPMILGIHGTQEDKNTIRYLEKNGIKFAFFNNTYGLNGQKMPDDRQYLVDMQDEKDEWLKPITEADANADVVVVFMHVGTEYVPIPSEDAQKKVAKAIDAGADIVVCAHPHVVEPYGVLTTKNGNTGLVYWSLGNFISNQKENPKLLGGVAKFLVQKTAVGEDVSFAVTEATFEGSVTHWDAQGYRAIPLKDYTEELARKHSGKHASLKELQKLFQEANEGFSKCGTGKASEKLPMSIGRLRK